MSGTAILTINTGSSSLKVGLYTDQSYGNDLIVEGTADGIGQERSRVVVRDAKGQTLRSDDQVHVTQQSALRQLIVWMKEITNVAPGVIGHRVVHGGPTLTQHQRITPAVIEELRRCVHFAPLHIPMALALIEVAEQSYPGIPQVACFDTSFHRTLPEVASQFPISSDLFDEGIRRYGFHGLSYESIVQQMGKGLPSRVVMAHLGSGASLAAVKNGESIDTTMGLTPTGGIPMATRSGDLDPGVLLYLMRTRGADADALESLLNREAGLKAVSGGISDMRMLLSASDAGDRRAQLAVEMFCIAIAKTVAAYVTVLGGLDMLVFSGGIGENSAAVRQEVCNRLSFLGIRIDESSNKVNAIAISAQDSVLVCIVESKEDMEIAFHCRRLVLARIKQTPAKA